MQIKGRARAKWPSASDTGAANDTLMAPSGLRDLSTGVRPCCVFGPRRGRTATCARLRGSASHYLSLGLGRPEQKTWHLERGVAQGQDNCLARNETVNRTSGGRMAWATASR